jgi:hypothetical protein
VNDFKDAELAGRPHAMTTIEDDGAGSDDWLQRTHAVAVNIGL